MGRTKIGHYEGRGEEDEDQRKFGDTASNHIARGWVMWNAQYSCKVKSKFNLTDFPFDSQKLKLDLKILQVKYSKMFSLIENQETECVACKEGRYSDLVGVALENGCKSCPIGYAQNSIGEAYCLPCMPGTKQDQEGTRFQQIK